MAPQGWEARNTALLALLGWLGGAVVTGQEFCNSPGDVPPPVLLLNVSSARQGDLAVAHCFVLSSLPASTIIFCKDGGELASQSVARGQSFAMLAFNLSVQSTGRYSCGFQLTDHLGQVRTSGLSVPWDLSVTGPPSSSNRSSNADNADPIPPCRRLEFGQVCTFAAFSLLVLVPSTYLLMKLVASKQRCQRLSSSCCSLATEKQ
ncbi:uncharacterized protein [Emydura macquarii macquarii]|uniref:uncharacterized protein n=1 Tax=Emydura macquarii macquarii TaxID=1129001 RepID=UPI00352AB53A